MSVEEFFLYTTECLVIKGYFHLRCLSTFFSEARSYSIAVVGLAVTRYSSGWP